MIRILLVDDQNLVQQGIKSLLEQDQNFHVIGTVEDGQSAIKQINLLRPDIVLLDIEMPGMNGITVTKYINHFLPETKVIILSSHEEKKYLVQALVAGASSYILKSSLMRDLKQAILAVDNGYSLIESRLLARVLNSGTVKLIPVKSETIKHANEPIIEESARRDGYLPDDNNLILLHKGEARKDTNDKLAEDNSTDKLAEDNSTDKLAEDNSTDKLAEDNSTNVATAPVLIDAEGVQKKNTIRETTAQEPSETVSKGDDQSSNLDDISNTVAMNNSNSSNSVLAMETSSLNNPKSEPKTKVQSDNKNSSPNPQSEVDTSLVEHTKLQKFKQDVKSSPLYNLNSDEPSYHTQIGINQIDSNMTIKGDKIALVPHDLSIKSSGSSKMFFASNIVGSKIKNVVSKNFLNKINERSEIQKIKVQIVNLFQLISSKFSLYSEQYISPIVIKYKPFFSQYKSKFFNLVGQRSTQRTLLNLGLMILGGMIVLLISGL